MDETKIRIKNMNKHLKDAKMTYWEHWLTATSSGLALLIHAWFPCILKDYASNKISKK
jgi:ABC-type phosphate/phosphonate transport system permease subunit